MSIWKLFPNEDLEFIAKAFDVASEMRTVDLMLVGMSSTEANEFRERCEVTAATVRLEMHEADA